MNLVDAGFRLFRMMLLEEWRLQRSFVGSFGAYFFPLFILFMSTIVVMLFPVGDGSSMVDVILVIMLLYGLSVGAIALMGEQIMERRLGEVHLLLKVPQLQPLSFRSTVSIFFVKEVFFYHLYSSLPFSLGIMIGGTISRTPLSQSLMLVISIFLVFTLGMSLSFLLSSLFVRSRVLGSSIIAVSVLTLVSLHYLEVWDPLSLIRFLHFRGDPLWLLVCFPGCIFLYAAAVLLMKENIGTRSRTHRSRELSIGTRLLGSERRRALLVKEWLELKRSGTLLPVLFSFIGPLLAVYGLVLLLQEGSDIDVRFNVIFFGALIGFFGMMTYSWLNNIEPNEALNLLPIDVPDIIDGKLLLYFLLTISISTVYIFMIALINGELDLLPVALVVGFSTNTYLAFITARLTGLKTNSMLLDAGTLVRFSLLVVPPLIFMVIMSFYLRDLSAIPVIIILAASLTLIAASFLAFKGIRKRWRRERFGF
ncbi:MAG: hypothetical protein R6V01_06255 [Thermoplasmatota archaeon]